MDCRRKTNIKKDLDFLIIEGKTYSTDTKRTIVFFKTCNETSDANYYISNLLPEEGKVFRDGELFDYLVEHITSGTGPKTQERILELFSSDIKCTQILLSTIFYGMGTQIFYILPNLMLITLVLHSNLSLQKICRNGQPYD